MYKMFPVVLYDFEILYFTLIEEHRLNIFEVLGQLFIPKRDENGVWRKLLKEIGDNTRNWND